MVEKILENIPDIYEMNQAAEKLRQLGMRDELEKLAGKYGIPKSDVEAFFSRKRYFLVDGLGKRIALPGASCWMKWPY